MVFIMNPRVVSQGRRGRRERRSFQIDNAMLNRRFLQSAFNSFTLSE